MQQQQQHQQSLLRSTRVLLALCCCMLLSPVQGAVTVDSNADCEIFLAKSSIPNAGWGVFVTRDYEMGDVIGPPGIGIAIIDPPPEIHTTFQSRTTDDALSEYLWDASRIGGFGEARDVELFLPGIGSNINVHPTLHNVLPSGATRSSDIAKDTVGSSTAYHNITFLATRSIVAGEELFLKPSDAFKSRWQRNFPSKSHYVKAQEIVTHLLTLEEGEIGDASQQDDSTSRVSESLWMDILRRLRTEIMKNEDSFVVQLLPRTYNQLLYAKAHGVAQLQLESRSIEWIQANGQCLDAIEEGPSTIAKAGHGGYAKRHIPMGSVVMPVPLVPVRNVESTFQIKSKSESSDDIELIGLDELPKNATQQLLLNYCFGHRDQSKVVFCPTTSGALINHHSTDYNVELTWATSQSKLYQNRGISRLQNTTSSSPDPEDYLIGDITGAIQMNPGMMESFKTRVMLELVATRDIQPGEELLLDYGKEWDEALRKNSLSHFLSNVVSFMDASDNDDEGFSVDKIALSTEVAPRYQYECLLYPDVKDLSQHGDSKFSLEQFDSNEAIDPSKWPEDWTAFYRKGKNRHIAWYPCKVRERTSDTTFQVDIYTKFSHRQPPIVMRRFRNCPANRIRQVDGWYQSEQHQPISFRHYIPFPDSIFPFSWRDAEAKQELNPTTTTGKQGMSSSILSSKYNLTLTSSGMMERI